MNVVLLIVSNSGLQLSHFFSVISVKRSWTAAASLLTIARYVKMTKQKFDLIIVDTTTPRPYEQATLTTEGIGGTEATVIRVAEGLAKAGAKVAVLEHNLTMPLMGENAYYLPIDMIHSISTEAMIMLRGIQFVDKFPKAKKFSWHQDVPGPALRAMRDKFIEHNVTVVGVSKWHKGAIQDSICDPRQTLNPVVKYVYNPVPDDLMVPPGIRVKYDRNKLVWPASPHKGLKRALELMPRLIEVSGNKDFKLHIFNPGYFGEDHASAQYIINHGAVPCATLWQHMSEALCVFYPTEFKETFGCIAAESNAVHTPILTQEIAALAETVSSRSQFTKPDNKSIIDTVIRWHGGDRPAVFGQDRFRLSNIVKNWYDLIRKS